MEAQQVFSYLYYDATDEFEEQFDTSDDSGSEKEHARAKLLLKGGEEKFFDFTNKKPKRKKWYRRKRDIIEQLVQELRKQGDSYKGPENAKNIDLAEPGEELRPAYIANDLSEEEEELLLSLLKKYQDVFAWFYKDLKGVDPKKCQHTIPTRDDAKPSRQRPYTYYKTFAKKIKEEIEKLKEVELIYEIEHIDWVSPIVVVPKKNGKLRIYVNLKRVNAATICDNYPRPITEHVLERVVGKEAYSLSNGFSQYNQLLIDPTNQHKTAFAIEWGIFAYKVKPFGLTNAPATFQRSMSHAFKEYPRNFLETL
ncbi:hypothetical protein L7F22_000848 [Adiantum nelumboides]|nr:hypothetical protein [Adiantum nelumboides]